DRAPGVGLVVRGRGPSRALARRRQLAAAQPARGLGQGDRLDLDQEVQDVAALAAAVAMEPLDPVAPSEQGKRRRAIGMERAAGFVLAAVAAQLDVAADDVGEVGVRPDLVQVLIVSWHGSSLKVEAWPGAAGDWNDAPSASHGSSGGG